MEPEEMQPEEIEPDELDFDDVLDGHDAEAGWLRKHLGSLVEVNLVSGRKVRGILANVDKKALVVQPEATSHGPVLVFKSAIETAEETVPLSGRKL